MEGHYSWPLPLHGFFYKETPVQNPIPHSCAIGIKTRFLFCLVSLPSWMTGAQESIMEFVGNIFGNHLPEALTVPQSVMVKQKWEFSGENFFFSVSSSVSVISLPQGVKSTHLSLSLTFLSPCNSQAAIDLTFNHSSSLCPSPLIWWLTPHLGLCSVDLNGSSLTLPFSDTLCQVPI